jgi:putative flippase GtrA
MRLSLEYMVRYGVAGGSAAVVDLAGFHLLTAGGAALLPAAVGSFLVAAVFNYIVSSIYVFNTPLSSRRLFAFVLFATAGLVINVSVTVGTVDLLGIPSLLAKATGTATAFSLNFLVNAFIVFRV